MPGPTYAQTEIWDDDVLARDRATSIELFVAERQAADPGLWLHELEDVEAEVRYVLEATNNLRGLTRDSVLALPLRAWHILRYCCGPPVSEEDLWTYVGGTKFKNIPAALADRTAEVFRSFVDPARFPWVIDDRTPTGAEFERAVAATVMPLAQQRFATRGRGTASQRQEARVGATLAELGYDLDVSKTQLWSIDDLARGSYSRERKLAGDKCDVPVRLRDGRILAIECKSSNGPKNGWKRLVREVAGKADTWRTQYGNQVVTAAVLAGVYDLACLIKGQDRHVAIFWEHDLAPLTEFISSTE